MLPAPPKSVTLEVDEKMEEIAPDVYGFTGILKRGKRFGSPCRMTVIRLHSTNDLIVYSPLDPNLVDLSNLGVVKAIIAPSGMHYLYAQRFKRAHPQATLYSSAGLQKKFPEWDWGVVLDGGVAEDVVSGEVLVRVMGSLRELKEVVVLHVRSGTVLVADLACNVTPRLVGRLPIGGRMFYRFVCLPNALDCDMVVRGWIKGECMGLFPELRGVVEEWVWDRMVCCHGEVVQNGAKESFRRGTFAFVKDRAG